MAEVHSIPFKACSKCGRIKSLELFGVEKRRLDGRRCHCLACDRKNDKRRGRSFRAVKLRVKYGISLEDYDRLFRDQDGRCAICGTDKPGGKHGVLMVDHDHQTGNVRGLLCARCNVILGKIGDSIEGVMRYIDYLNRPQISRTLERRGYAIGSNHASAKLTESDVVEILKLLASGMTQREIASRFGVDKWNIWAIRSGRAWKHVPRNSPDAITDTTVISTSERT